MASDKPNTPPKTNGQTGHDERGKFTKGNPGRPVGIRNQNIVEVKQVARRVLLGENPVKYFENLQARIMSGAADHMEKFLAEHLWGKPRDVVSGDVTHRFVFIGFGDGNHLHVSSQIPMPRLPEAIDISPANGDQKSPDVLAPPQRQRYDLVELDDLQHEPENRRVHPPVPPIETWSQDSLGRQES